MGSMDNQGTLTGETAENHSSPFAVEESEETGESESDPHPSGGNSTLADWGAGSGQTSLAGFED